jgi:hypothetical protein
MDELLAAAAKATGMSENMVKRSATARAKAQGTTVEAVLAEWAGVEVPAGTTADAPAAAAAPAATAPAASGGARAGCRSCPRGGGVRGGGPRRGAGT